MQGIALKKTLCMAVLEGGGFDGLMQLFHVDGGLICVQRINLCCFRNIRIRENGVLDLPQVVLISSTAEKAVK